MIEQIGASDSLFCYGTLEFPELMRAVTGRYFPQQEAVLTGHARYRVRDEDFPGVIAQAAAEVRGVMYGGVDETALHLIDLYEDDCYSRRLLEVTLLSGATTLAWVYVVPAALRMRLTREAWDRATFARCHLNDWLRALGA